MLVLTTIVNKVAAWVQFKSRLATFYRATNCQYIRLRCGNTSRTANSVNYFQQNERSDPQSAITWLVQSRCKNVTCHNYCDASMENAANLYTNLHAHPLATNFNSISRGLVLHSYANYPKFFNSGNNMIFAYYYAIFNSIAL